MLNPQPHINTHEPWIWSEFERQLPLENVRTGIGAGAASPAASLRLPSWSPGEVVATNEAYGAALRTIGASDPRIIAIEGEADSSTYHQVLPDPRGGRSVQTVIAEQESASAEQRMVAAAISLQTRGLIPFAAAFADSWTSAHDLIRMAAIKSADIRLIGSHAGVAGDEDASSQVALEDIATFRAIHDSTLLVASDANQTAALVETMLERRGVVYLRTLRIATRSSTDPASASRSAGRARCDPPHTTM